jgi:hypothetical protein
MRRPFRQHLIAIIVGIAIVTVGFYFGWLSEAPPLLAPGVR